jgi:UDP-hydrolysing UDP-N-acetyl-D-glucosamine 2-epimerase
MMRVAVVSVARSDYGIYRPVLTALRDHGAFDVEVWAGSAHLSSLHGHTVDEIERDGFRIGARIESLLASDSPEAIAKSMGLGLAGFGQAFAARRPDLLMVLGDRFDMCVAALAALPFKIAVAHLHGGELTHGAIDDALRHAITKLSHVHFTSTAGHRRRVIQLGEDPTHVHHVGAPALDALRAFVPLSLDALSAHVGRPWPKDYVLSTLHPETLDFEHTREHAQTMLAALEHVGTDVVFTMPNADTHGAHIRDEIARFVARHPRSLVVESLGTERYWSAMSHARALVGNSSSGIIEAPTLGVPVVNIGDRQHGRERAANVIDVPHDVPRIREAITRVIDPAHRASLTRENPYDAGGAAARIVRVLSETRDIASLPSRKRFFDVGELS